MELLVSETWRPCDINPKYEISTIGNVRNKNSGFVLKHQEQGGRRVVSLMNGDGKKATIYRVVDLMAGAFFGGFDASKYACFANGNESDYSVENLRFLSNDEIQMETQPLNGEVWRDVVGFEGHYKVSNKGRVLSLKRTVLRNPKKPNGCPRTYKETLLPLILNDKGYYKVNLCKDGGHIQREVQRLVAMAFLPNPNNYPCVNHIDCDKRNNRVENLEWCTYKMNSEHAARNGRYDNAVRKYRESLPRYKVFDKTGKCVFIGTTAEIAARFGYCDSNAVTAALRYAGGKMKRANIQLYKV